MVSVLVQFLSLLCFIFMPINGQMDLPNTNKDYLTLAETAAHLARKYFCQESTTLIVIERAFHSDLRSFNELIFEYILQNLSETTSVQLYFGKTDNQPWENHILIVDSEQAFVNIVSNFPQSDFDNDYRFLIILTNYTSDYFRTIHAIFEECKNNNVIDVNILVNHSFLGVCMYKYNIFSETKCHVAQPYLSFRLVDGFEKLGTMFSQKLLNFHRCPLRICAQLNHPMLTFSGDVRDPKPTDKYWSNLRGIDGELIRILSTKLNFTIDLLPFPRERTYIENHTGFGCYAKLLTKKADIAIGGFSGSDPKRIALTPSILYHYSPIVFIVRGRRELDCVNRLGRPFNIAVWHSIFALLIVGALLIQSLRILRPLNRHLVLGKQHNALLLNFFAIFLGYPVTRVPKGNIARYLLILWLVMTLIIRSAYQGSLYDSIRIDRFEKTPKNYEQLVRRNYKFIISKSYLDIDIFTRNQSIVSDKKHFDRLKLLGGLEGNYATVSIQNHVLSYLEMNYRKGCDLRIIDEQIYQHQTAMYFHKHSIYAKPFNDNLNQFNYYGIIRHIAGNNAKDRRLFRDSKEEGRLRPMTNDRIWSLYQIFVGLMIVTVGVFVLELLSAYFVKLRTILNWLH